MAGIFSKGKGFQFATIHDYAKAYRDGTTTPEEVAKKGFGFHRSERCLSSAPLRAFIAINSEAMRQARESTRRIREGKPLNNFDWVAVAVKSEMDDAISHHGGHFVFRGHPRKGRCNGRGTLASAGALLLGKTNMHEIGSRKRQD